MAAFSRRKRDLKVVLGSNDKIEPNISALVLLNLLNSLQKSDILLGKPRI